MRRLIATMKHSIVGIVMFLTLGLLAAPLPAEAQQAGKVYSGLVALAVGRRRRAL